jgi:hypothetical protein
MMLLDENVKKCVDFMVKCYLKRVDAVVSSGRNAISFDEAKEIVRKFGKDVGDAALVCEKVKKSTDWLVKAESILKELAVVASATSEKVQEIGRNLADLLQEHKDKLAFDHNDVVLQLESKRRVVVWCVEVDEILGENSGKMREFARIKQLRGLITEMQAEPGSDRAMKLD